MPPSPPRATAVVGWVFAGTGVVLVLGAVVFAVLMLASMSVDSVRVRPSKARSAPLPLLLLRQPATTPPPSYLRVRVLNVCRLPWRRPPFAATLFQGADLLLLQEMFRTPSVLCSDPTPAMLREGAAAAAAHRWHAALHAKPQRRGTVTDSGLMGAACQPWGLAWVAGGSLGGSLFPDSLADKGVAVFEVLWGGRPVGLRVATAHLQAGSDAPSAQAREAQLGHAFQMARLAGARLFAGDFNAEREWLVARAPAWATYVPSVDGLPTTLDGQQLDHVWVLPSSSSSSSGLPTVHVRTNPEVGKAVHTDHAALDLVVGLAPHLP